LQHTSGTYDIARQLLRSGTSIEANTEEAIGAASKKEINIVKETILN
jgi:four helix bundle protein